MQVEMDPGETVTALWRECDSWAERAGRLQKLADAGFFAGSCLHEDNATVTVREAFLAVSEYVQERLWSAARARRWWPAMTLPGHCRHAVDKNVTDEIGRRCCKCPVSRPTRDASAGRAYLDLQNQARRERWGTQELLTMYVVERWLARLGRSSYVNDFVLKGGMLLAAFGNRRPTVDADALARNMASDEDC